MALLSDLSLTSFAVPTTSPNSATTAQGRIGHYRVTAEATLLECLTRGFGISIEEGASLFHLGAVYQEGVRARSDGPVSRGQYLRVHLRPKRFPVQEIDWRGAIVHEDDDFLVVNKPSGIPVHATVDNTDRECASSIARRSGCVALHYPSPRCGSGWPYRVCQKPGVSEGVQSASRGTKGDEALPRTGDLMPGSRETRSLYGAFKA